MLPVRPPDELPATLEYEPIDDAPPWLIGRWRGLAEAFSLHPEEVCQWHHALAGQGRPWLVIRRIYAVAAMWGDGNTPEDAEDWTFGKLASALGVPESKLKQDLADAVEFWRRARTAAATASRQEAAVAPSQSASSGVNPLDGLPDFSMKHALTEEQIERLLSQLRFNAIRAKDDRLYVAGRILELKALLSDHNTRESARQLIIMEMNLASYEATQISLRTRQASIENASSISKELAQELIRIGDALQANEKAHSALQTKYFAAAGELGQEEREEGEVRRVALGTISHLTEAHRRYYESGDRTLIDGVFAADEVIWLTTPLEMRPAQYRADLVIRINEALQPENLWGPNYKPTVIQRDACRRLAKIVQQVADEEPPVPETIPGVDDVVAADSFEDEEVEAEAPAESSVPSVPSVPPEDPDPIHLHPDNEPCMAVG